MMTNGRVTFVGQVKSYYDFDLGKRVESDGEQSTCPAHIADLGIDRSKQLFGDYESGRVIVQVMQPYLKDVDHLKINGARYNLLSTRQNGRVFYCEVGS